MRNQHIASKRLGRHTHLARALGLALSLGMSGALAAQASPSNQNQSHIRPQAMLTRGAVSGQATLPASATGSHVHAAVGNSTAATIMVSNCADSGSGSLREAVGNASSGDTIDMSGVPGDCTISLVHSIFTTADDLTIKGDSNSKYPIIDGQNSVTPIIHYGAGTLTLTDTYIHNGKFTNDGSSSFGGCIASFGNVALVDSQVKYCHVENTATGTAEGGAIAASGNVTLSGSTIRQGYAENTSNGPAQGGAIRAGGSITIDDASTIANSSALASGTGGARGGGTYSQGTTMINHQSLVDSNTAEADGSGSAIGGGIYSSGNLSVIGNSAVTSNTATANGAFAQGGGARTAGDATVKYAQIEDNLVHSGTSTAQGGGLEVINTLMTKYATIANNQATSDSFASMGGGIQARSNASIRYTTISGNTAQRIGGLDLGGINATQTLKISNSTVSGNVATNSEFGAGIYVGYDTQIQNSTITGNVESNPGDAKYGAGLCARHDTNVAMSSTIISDNKIDKTDNTSEDSDFGASQGNGSNVVLSGDHNLMGIPTHVTEPTGNGNLVLHGDPVLGPLQDNGGLTRTHAVLPGSSALDTGVSNGFPTDQRGTGFKRTAGAAPDIGAFEMGGDVIFANGFESL